MQLIVFVLYSMLITKTLCITEPIEAYLLLHLSWMYYARCLSYHSNIEAALFACFSSGWATTTGRLLGPKVGNRDATSEFRILRNRFMFWTGSIFWILFYQRANK